MKKFINILLAAAVTALAVVSCQKEEQVKPGTPDPEGCYGVYFPVQEASGDHIYSPDMDRSVTITVTRTNTSGAITVPYTVVSDDEAVFTFGKIEFADGQDETELEVTFENIEEGKKCAFSVQLNDDNAYVSHYNSGAIAFDFSVMCVEMLTLKTEDGSADAKVNFTISNDFLGDFGFEEDAYEADGKIEYYEVNGVRYGKLVVNQEGGVWFSGAEINFIWYPNVKYEYGESVYQPVEVPLGYTGYELDGSEVGEDHPCAVLFSDYYHHYKDVKSNDLGTYLEFMAKYGESYLLSYYDGHGGFHFNLVYDIEGTNYWYGFNEDSVLGIAEGYLRVDYSLKVEADYPDSGYTPVLFTVGADVEKVDYAIYEGSLNSVQIQARVDAISEGKEENVVSVDEFAYDEYEDIYYAYIGVSPEETGEYTLVAVAFNKISEEVTASAAQTFATASFFHVSADDDADYDVEVSVFTEDTPARYQEIHTYDSFAYGVCGKDLTEVHLAFYTLSTVQKYGLDVIVADAKADEKGTYAVSADVLAQINADGGYYDIATGMKAKTSYVVVAWATNGSKENAAFAVYTTDPLPYVWKNLGKGQYTDDVACGLYGINPITVSCNVYEEEITPGLYAIDGFQLPLVAAIFEEPEEEMAKEEDENWRNSFIIIDATNPDSVIIELQDYGVCLNPSDGFIDGITSVYNGKPFSVGTLKDGVISFPTAKGLLCLLDGDGYYYANQHGAFKLVLPEAASTAAAPANYVSMKPEKAHLEFAVARPVYEREVKSISVETKTVDYSGRKESQPKSKKALTPVSDYLAK